MQGSGLARAVHDRNENLQLSVPCCPMSRPLCCSRSSFVCRPSPALSQPLLPSAVLHKPMRSGVWQRWQLISSSPGEQQQGKRVLQGGGGGGIIE